MENSVLSRNSLAIGIVVYLLTAAPVLIGVVFAIDCVNIPNKFAADPSPDLTTACCRYDGIHYGGIVEEGYRYRKGKRSSVAFFPGYPLASRLVILLTESPVAAALLMTANIMLIGAFAAMSSYLQVRWPEAAPSDRHLVLALLGVFPPTFFFRMGYSESTFLFFGAVFLNGIVRRWSLLSLALVAGVATGIRPVGVACTAAFVWHVISDSSLGTLSRRAFLVLTYLPIACWGLLAYMAYQEAAFGNALAFVETQDNWSYASPKRSEFSSESDRLWDKVECLLTAEPVISVYDPDSPRFWKNRVKVSRNLDYLLFVLYFWNPIIFGGAILLVLFGWYRRWLDRPETVLSLSLLMIPYVTRAYENSMASHARFAAVVIPAYLVAVKIIRPLPPWIVWAILALFTVMLMVWSALFAAGYDFI